VRAPEPALQFCFAQDLWFSNYVCSRIT
jgi:hypothetical protein